MLQQDIDLLYIEHAGMMMNGSVLKNRPHCYRLVLVVHKIMMMIATAIMMIIWWWWWMRVFWKIGQTVIDCYWCKRGALGSETDICCSNKSQQDYELHRWWSISTKWENIKSSHNQNQNEISHKIVPISLLFVPLLIKSIMTMLTWSAIISKILLAE